MRRRSAAVFLAGFFLVACNPAGPPRVTRDRRHAEPMNPYSSKAGDEKWSRGSVEIQNAALEASTLTITGNLPTPCHELRLKIPSSPDKGFLRIEAWSVADPALMCAQMLQPFSVHLEIPVYLETEITLNGKAVGH